MASSIDCLVVARTNPACDWKMQMYGNALCQMMQINLLFPCHVSQKGTALCGHADVISVI